MKIKSKLLLLFLFSLSSIWAMAQKELSLASPNGKLKVDISIGKTIEYQISHNGDIMLNKSPISMSLTDGRRKTFGTFARLDKSEENTKNETIDAPIYKKSKVINHYNELVLKFRGDYNIIFRAYDDGIAYRFESLLKGNYTVLSEQVELNFPADQPTYIPYVKRDRGDDQFYNSFENLYEYKKLSEWDTKRYAFTPLLTESKGGKKIAIIEADLLNYPGMYLNNGNGSNTLKGVFAPYPKTIQQGGHNMLQGEVKSREEYIAKYEGPTLFPWRAFVISENDKDLTNNDMVYKLAQASQGDYSWVKPGKVAWEWWNDWNLYGVDFKAGINNETYKYYIDFASDHGVEYVILDEGWAVNKQADLMQVIPEIDLQELVNYGKQKNVGIILWAGYYAINRDMEGICKHYADMGVKGFKVDFMDRDDQAMVKFHTDLAEIAAKHKLLIDYHGTYKPTGLQRTYPNVINFEGVHGLEQMKWSSIDKDQVTYDVTIPFTRMVAGPMDYTQGAMRNATKRNYRPVNSEAMSQGTRCRQLAQYVIFESPLNMLCDSPSNYMSEPECTDFIAKIPTVWDETVALNGEVAKYVSIARRAGNEWYVGSMTNWDERELELDLSFLGDGDFEAEIFRDGANAARAARDYKKEVIDIPASKKVKILMAPAGGYAMKITRK